MRLISVIIPSYNTELYLARCLDSLLYDEDIVKYLDIIIVNDGSKDNTQKIAECYQERYPDNIAVINKENGGHGSTINAGINVAKGKYLKVLDSDDWVNIFDFGRFVKSLEDLEEDILITNYQQDILYDSSTVAFNFYEGDDSTQDISKTTELLTRENFFFMFSMHSMTIKTDRLKKVWGDGLLEKTFYVDQQYVVKALLSAENFRTLNYDIYRYFIGRPEQSVSAEGFFKHRQDHERVLKWLLSSMKQEIVPQRKHLAKVVHRQIEAMIATHYELYYKALYATKSEVLEILEFNAYLENSFPEIHVQIPAAHNLRRRLSPVRRYIKRKLLRK